MIDPANLSGPRPEDELRLRFSDRLCDALHRGDLPTARLVIADALEHDIAEGVIHDDIIRPAMASIGEFWARGELTIADEHLATQISYRIVALLQESLQAADRRRTETVMLAAPGGEEHVLGLQMAAGLLEGAGFPVQLLGASVPVEALQSVVARHHPRVVGLSFTMPQAAVRAREAVEAVWRADPSIVIVCGGALAPPALAGPQLEVLGEVGGVVEAVDGLLRRPHLN